MKLPQEETAPPKRSRRDMLAMLHSRWSRRYKAHPSLGRASKEKPLPCYYCGERTTTNDYCPGLETFNKLGPLEVAKKGITPTTVPACRSCSTHLGQGANAIATPQDRKKWLEMKFSRAGFSLENMRIKQEAPTGNRLFLEAGKALGRRFGSFRSDKDG